MALVSYLLFGQTLFLSLSLIGLSVWGVVYIYIDRILLIFLNAREVIDTDEHRLFQIIKNNTYKYKGQIPKIYVYDGNFENCLLLESRNKWTIVLDKKMLESIDDVALGDLVEFLFKYYKNGLGLIKTKALGISVLFYGFVFWFVRNLLFLKTNSKLFKTISAFILIMTRPLLFPLEVILKRKKKISLVIIVRY